MILSFPIGSSVYFVLFFILLSPLSPVTRAKYADYVTSKCKSDGQDTVIDAANTVKSILPANVRYVFSNYTVRIKKSSLGQRKRDTVFSLILLVFPLIPLKADLLHENNILW